MPAPPVDPGYFDKVNYVIDSWSQPCDAPWYIYIETMKPAALEAFIVLLSFGWADVARGAFRPKGLSRRSSKRRGKWSRRIPKLPEIGNALGKAIPIGEQIEDFVKWGCNTRTLWRIDNVAQAVMYGWLVADVTINFAYNWTSLLYEGGFCADPPLGSFSYSGAGGSPTPDNVWKVAGFGTRDYQDAPPSWTFTQGFSGPTGCSVAAGIAIHQRLPFGPPKEFRVVIWNLGTNEPFDDPDPCELEAPGDGSACAFANVPPNTQFQVRSWMSGTSFATLGDGSVTATANPS